MDSIINEICERIISKNEIRESKEYIETFEAAQIEYDKLMNMLNDDKQPRSTNMRLRRVD